MRIKYKIGHYYLIKPFPETIEDYPKLGDRELIPAVIEQVCEDRLLIRATGGRLAFINPEEVAHYSGKPIGQLISLMLLTCIKGAFWQEIKEARHKATGRQVDSMIYIELLKLLPPQPDDAARERRQRRAYKRRNGFRFIRRGWLTRTKRYNPVSKRYQWFYTTTRVGRAAINP